MVPFIYDGETVVRTIRQDGNVWFVVKDVCMVLRIKNVKQATDTIPEGDVCKTYLPSSSGEQEYLIVNEPGFYRLVFRSNKPAAKAFSDWVYNEVLPSIRKTGKFSTHAEDAGKDHSSLKDSHEVLDADQHQMIVDKLKLISEENIFYTYTQSLSYLLSVIKIRDVLELKQSHWAYILPIIENMHEYQQRVYSTAYQITEMLRGV